MNDLSEMIVLLFERLRRRPVMRWFLRLALVLSGVFAQVWMSLLAGPGAWTVAGLLAVALGAGFARTVVPLLAAALLVIEAAVIDLPASAMVPVAVALLVWHVCASLLSSGRPWATLGVGVISAYRTPALAALGAIALVAVVAAVTSGFAWGEVPVVSALALLVVVLGAMVALWPSASRR